jgi:hypothetical protein
MLLEIKYYIDFYTIAHRAFQQIQNCQHHGTEKPTSSTQSLTSYWWQSLSFRAPVPTGTRGFEDTVWCWRLEGYTEGPWEVRCSCTEQEGVKPGGTRWAVSVMAMIGAEHWWCSVWESGGTSSSSWGGTEETIMDMVYGMTESMDNLITCQGMLL